MGSYQCCPKEVFFQEIYQSSILFFCFQGTPCSALRNMGIRRWISASLTVSPKPFGQEARKSQPHHGHIVAKAKPTKNYNHLLSGQPLHPAGRSTRMEAAGCRML